MLKKAVVLNGDANYFPMIETTMKSICAHHSNLKFYILNEDIPMEWFAVMNQRLKSLDSEVLNVKVPAWKFEQFFLPKFHLHKAAYFRFLLAEYVEEERAVYFDSDMIVTEPLDELWTMDLQGYPLAAVPDMPTVPDGFNSGLMVIDIPRWKEENIGQNLLELTAEIHEQTYGDQGVLNTYFEQNWLKLPLRYNLQVGSDQVEFRQDNMEWYQEFTELPSVIHFTLWNKPWKQLKFNRFREYWWLYYGLSWEDVLLKKPSLKLSWEEFSQAPTYHSAIFTNAAEMEQLEKLIQSLPEVEFSILAYTDFAESVMHLERFPNVSLYSNFDPLEKEKVLKQMDFYLDINYFDEIVDIIKTVQELKKPIYGFTTTSHDKTDYSNLYDVGDVDRMIEDIKGYLSSSRSTRSQDNESWSF